MRRAILLLTGLCLIYHNLHAQDYKISGKVLLGNNSEVFEETTVFIQELGIQTNTDDRGYYEIQVPGGTYKLEAFRFGMETGKKLVKVNADLEVNFLLRELSESLDEVEVVEVRTETSGIARLRAVEDFGIYEAKKNELILLDDFASNKVTNNARQIFAKVPGLNIWESDFAGLQLDIAARGLGPSRSANFNTRQKRIRYECGCAWLSGELLHAGYAGSRKN